MISLSHPLVQSPITVLFDALTRNNSRTVDASKHPRHKFPMQERS